MLQNIHLFHGVPNRHILTCNSPVSSVYAIYIMLACISIHSWLKDVSKTFFNFYPVIQLKLAAQIPHFSVTKCIVSNLSEFGEHLLIKLNQNFQILKKNSTFTLKFDYMREHLMNAHVVYFNQKMGSPHTICWLK